ncbi:MAG TPA: hypothetical protein VKC34_05625, partial [Blastocatellia bacterium]|nr:hypothetical protein [Blastocatellia bacterium]
TSKLRERNAEILRRSEERVIKEIDRAAEEALESSRTRMPVPESAAEGVYADGRSRVGQADFANKR